ncbi:MAG: VOC family protein [Deltaproteobacteria bacterium]|nr:MAG: VOC family protein [Deltaproteobacteria bacterium]
MSTAGIHHVGLTVLDVEVASHFFRDALGFREVGRKPYPAVFVSDGVVMITLWQVQHPPRAFDRKSQVGLHHLALRLAPETSLDDVYAALIARDDTTGEFAPEPLGASGLRHCMLLGPGGLRLELVEAG